MKLKIFLYIFVVFSVVALSSCIENLVDDIKDAACDLVTDGEVTDECKDL